MEKRAIASFDIDGVIFLGPQLRGINPSQPYDIIVTGRSIEEYSETETLLANRGISCEVYYNPLPFAQKTRETSGIHKGNTLRRLKDSGMNIIWHIEDDEIQAEQIIKICPDIPVILMVHNLTNKENARHLNF